MSGDWKSLWEFRGMTYEDEDLKIIDGYDGGLGISDKGFKNVLKLIINKLDLRPNDVFLDVGCGAGAILYPISNICENVAGIDYAHSLIEVAKKYVSHGDLHCCAATEMPFDDGFFDKTLSFSVFQYFPSLIYAKTVIDELIRCTKETGRILIGDIPDISKKTSYEKIKSGEGEKGDFNDTALTHLYYEKGFFSTYLRSRGLTFEIFDYVIEEYDNSKYRFNVLMEGTE